MTRRIGLCTLVLWTAAGTAVAQNQVQPRRGPAPQPVQVRPNQPVVPQHPTLHRRPPADRPLPAPFRLASQQEDYLDRVLQAWEGRSKKVKTFASKFTRWEYDPVFGPADGTHRYMDAGEVKYSAPDRGMFRVTSTDKDGKMVRIEPGREEHWVCNGKSVYEFNHPKKQLIERVLPPEMQGKAIANGPLPFLFGSEAAKLKQRYYLRVITPAELQNQQIWLEAFPRWPRDAADFKRAELILTLKELNPQAIQTYDPNGKNQTVYKFHDMVINDPLGFLKGNPFTVFTPLGWKKIVEQPAPARVSRVPANGVRQ